jgi:hypothetical protein
LTLEGEAEVDHETVVEGGDEDRKKEGVEAGKNPGPHGEVLMDGKVAADVS